MAGNVEIRFQYPTARDDGELLDPEEIGGARIEARVEGSPEWAEIAVVPFPQTSRLFPDMASGTWYFRGIVLGAVAGDDSPPTEEVRLVIPKGEMGVLQNFTVELV